jgi:hypothetical protein
LVKSIWQAKKEFQKRNETKGDRKKEVNQSQKSEKEVTRLLPSS